MAMLESLEIVLGDMMGIVRLQFSRSVALSLPELL